MRQAKDGSLSEAALIAATGISRRYLTRLRQLGLVPIIEPRRGRGRGRGTTSLEYPPIAIATINRHEELRPEFKRVEDRRWRLWLERYPVRIASDLEKVLAAFKGLKIRTLDDLEATFPATLWKPSNMPRGHPLRVIFRDLSDDDLHSVGTIVICVLLGIKLPLFDEPNPGPFRAFKRAFGLPPEWEMPPGMLDAFPHVYEQMRNALSTATADEREAATAVCRLLSRLLDNPDNSRRGAIVILGAELPWRPIKLASLIWPSPLARAATVGLIILCMRLFNSALGGNAAAAFASVASGVSVFLPESPIALSAARDAKPRRRRSKQTD